MKSMLALDHVSFFAGCARQRDGRITECQPITPDDHLLGDIGPQGHWLFEGDNVKHEEKRLRIEAGGEVNWYSMYGVYT